MLLVLLMLIPGALLAASPLAVPLHAPAVHHSPTGLFVVHSDVLWDDLEMVLAIDTVSREAELLRQTGQVQVHVGYWTDLPEGLRPPEALLGGSPGGSAYLENGQYSVWVTEDPLREPAVPESRHHAVILGHEVFGHVFPHALDGTVAWPHPCTDTPPSAEDVSCAVRRENLVREALGLPMRTSDSAHCVSAEAQHPKEACPGA